MFDYDKHQKEEIEYWKKKLDETKKTISSMSSEELIDNLLYAHNDYTSYLNRDDGIYWSQKSEDYTGEIYFTLRNEIIRRMDHETS